jgi:hypothetical protein
LPGFSRDFLSRVVSRLTHPQKVRSCDLSTRDRISTGGPGEIWPLFV